MKHAKLVGHHWYDPIARVEHKAADYLAADFDHTVDDMNRVHRRFRNLARRHPVALFAVKAVLFTAALFGVLAAQYYHALGMAR